jgi:hypothetical protein
LKIVMASVYRSHCERTAMWKNAAPMALCGTGAASFPATLHP